MNSMLDALKNAAVIVENGFVPYEKISDVNLPFGSDLDDSYCRTEYYNNALNRINWHRKNAEVFCYPDFLIRKENYISKWLKEHDGSCLVLQEPKLHEERNGYLERHTSESQLSLPVRYGLADVVLYFEYSSQYECFSFTFSSRTLSYKNPEQKELYFKYHNEFIYTKNDKDKFFWAKENVFPKCEFIPIVINTDDGCHISHKKYSDYLGVHDEVTSPCLGKNIKKHPVIVERLQNWMNQGGYIMDHMFYLIIEDRKSSDKSLYLRPWKVKE